MSPNNDNREVILEPDCKEQLELWNLEIEMNVILYRKRDGMLPGVSRKWTSVSYLQQVGFCQCKYKQDFVYVFQKLKI